MKLLMKQLGKAACYVFYYFAMQVAVMMGAMILVSVFYMIEHVEILMQNDPMAMNAMILEMTDKVMAMANEIAAISGVLSIVILILFFLIRKKSILKEFNIQKVSAGGYIWPALMGFGLTFAVSLVMSFLPEQWLASYEESSALLSDTSVLVMFFSSVIVAPIAEEMLFRGLVFTRLRKAMPTWIAIMVTSLSFAVLHGQIVWIMYAFVLGVILTCLAAKYDSIIPGIVMHMVFNFFGGFMSEWELPEIVMGLMVIAGLGVLIPAMVMAFLPKKKQEAESLVLEVS